MPRVSVIIPTYNRRAYLQEAIDSVLAQTYTDYEVIVIDDGSTDGTGEALRARYGERIYYEWQENQGESVARNRGIALAQGEYIAFLDSDDLWLPEKVEKQVAFLDEHPETRAVFCQAHTCDAHGERLQQVLAGDLGPDAFTLEALLMTNTISGPGSTLVLDATLLRKAGSFDPQIRFAEDWDLCLRIRIITEIGYLPEPLASVRVHGNNQWRLPRREQVERSLQDHLRLLERAFDACKESVPDWEALRRRSFGRQYAEAAFNGYARGLCEQARGWLEQAILLAPKEWPSTRIYQHLLGIGTTLIATEPSLDMAGLRAYADHAIAFLPARAELPLGTARRLLAALCAEKSYRCYLASRYRCAAYYGGLSLLKDFVRQVNIGSLRRLAIAAARSLVQLP
jgi:glycosyltransferase involved in cell wall biosynthesis